MFAIFGRTFIGMDDSLKDADLGGLPVSQLFGSVPQSLITMMQVITMDSWTSGIGRPLHQLQSWT